MDGDTKTLTWIELPSDYFVDGCRCVIRFSGELVPNDCPIAGHPPVDGAHVAHIVSYQNSGGMLVYDLVKPERTLTMAWGPDVKPCRVCGEPRYYGSPGGADERHAECVSQDKRWSEIGDQIYRSPESLRYSAAVNAAREAFDESVLRQMREAGIPEWKIEQLIVWNEDR